MEYRGTHVIVDLSQCDFDRLNDAHFLENLLSSAALRSGCTVIHTWSHQFSPQGVTSIVVLAESHISIHTVPEEQKAWLDTFTCGDKAKPEKAVELILEQLQPGEHSSLTITRH
jgi:S-adenosylmethionine decarboxylase